MKVSPKAHGVLAASLLTGGLLMSAAVVAPADATSPTVDCGSQIGYSPYCNTIAGVPVTAKGYLPGSNKTKYCYVVWISKGKAIQVGAQMIGHKSGKLHTVRSGKYGQLCVGLPSGQCPKVNLFWVNGDMANNLGTFASCRPSWQLPTKKHPNFKLCKTNKGSERMWLDLYQGKTLSESTFADPGKTTCVTQKFTQKHPQQRLEVRAYTGTGTPVTEDSILTVAVYRLW